MIQRHSRQFAVTLATDGGCGCQSVTSSSSADGTPSFVFALGRIEPRFSSLAMEKEFAQITGRSDTAGLTDRETLHKVLSDRHNRYLARNLCWVMTIEGLETYILAPRDPGDYDLLIDSVRPSPSAIDVDVVIGILGPLASSTNCNGLMLPIVAFDQIYSFDTESFVTSIPRPEAIPEDRFEATSRELLERILQVADNAGSTDEHRALNYLAVRYSALYALAAERFAANQSLSNVSTRVSPLSGARHVIEVVFAFTHRQTDVTDQYFARVDVTEEFPFLVTKMQSYYDRS